MAKSLVVFLAIFCLSLSPTIPVHAQNPVPTPLKKLKATRIQQPPKIDGVLDDAAWQQAEVATDFIQRNPNPGKKEEHKTEVRITYDDVALYVGALMHDVSPDSIFRELSKRDNFANTDFFGVFLDTYHDKLNGYGFLVTPAGVQLDARYSPDSEDEDWNAVWESKAILAGNNWVVEMRIPYSAIRFSNADVQTWGINFMRNRMKKREDFFWSPVDPKVNGFLNQWGVLEGIENIKSPLRLSLTPYVSGYVQHYPSNNAGKSNASYSFNGGMDIKYGLNESFTLDMTLIPDFGQVQSDNRVLNLSPFEVQYNENRQFFTEGTELFNKGNYFYSRRIGQTPINYYAAQAYEDEGGLLKRTENLVTNPGESKLLNATKISGRTKKNLGIGIFNATTANMYATAQDETGNERRILTQPLTNYNIVVFDQALKNNSYVSFVNTNVMRNGHTYDANLTGALFRFANKKNTYSVEGKGSLSQKYGVNQNGKADIGHSYMVRAGKISGNWQYDFAHSVESENYDPNDLGILFQNNSVRESASLRYNIFKPFWKLNRLGTYLGVDYARRYKPFVFQNFGVFGEVFMVTKKQLTLGTFFGFEPIKTYDFFEPRVNGRFYTFPVNNNIGGFLSTDFRKKLALNVNFNYRSFKENSRRRLNIYLSPRYRFNNQFSVNADLEVSHWPDDMGFANGYDIAAHADTIMFGRRNLQIITNTLQGNYIFTNRMSLSLRGRHYWSKVLYREYYSLAQDGGLQPDKYQGNHDTNFNAFNIDMVFSWWFAPGSEMSIVWKNAISPESNKIINSYFDNFGHTLRSPQLNSLSIKILYFLDYQNLKRKNKSAI